MSHHTFVDLKLMKLCPQGILDKHQGYSLQTLWCCLEGVTIIGTCQQMLPQGNTNT